MSDKEFVGVDDTELINILSSYRANATGDWLNSSDMARDRMKATYEYGMLPIGHLQPQGVSQIVSSDTVEAVEGYLAILAELMLNNNKIARFTPTGKTPTDVHKAKVASDLVNYVIFKQNPGWTLLNSWIKSALMWRTSVVRWDYIEDFEYKFEEYEEISQEALDMILSDEKSEVVGTPQYYPETVEDEENGQKVVNVYRNVKIRKHIPKNRVDIKLVAPDALRIDRDATCIKDAAYVGIFHDLTRSEVRKYWPDYVDNIDWDRVGDGSTSWTIKYSEETAARKQLTGQEYYQGAVQRGDNLSEATRPVGVEESWLYVDRDGDGIAELKHIITIGDQILLEEDVEEVNLAELTPFEIPFEFHGLGVSDLVRPTTLASTAILRGFVENVYLTNYAPRLADPNVVDFGSLQNMKPKQVIATNGNPQQAVNSLAPDNISTGTVPLMEFLQLHKEQATGLSKAAQGLNDTLYVSGNSDEKMARAMSAAQVRIQYMARRFAETGFKRLIEGVYKTIRDCMSGQEVEFYDSHEYLSKIDPAELPSNLILNVDVDVGENSNSNITRKMEIVGGKLLPALKEAGAGGVIKPEAAAHIAAKSLEALDLDPLDYLVDYTTEEFKKQAEASRKAEIEAEEKRKKLEEQIKQLDITQREATLALTNLQSKNAIQDNARQMLVAMDRHHQEWADIYIKAAKEGVEPPPKPDIKEMIAFAMQFITLDASMPLNAPKVEQEKTEIAANAESPMDIPR